MKRILTKLFFFFIISLFSIFGVSAINGTQVIEIGYPVSTVIGPSGSPYWVAENFSIINGTQLVDTIRIPLREQGTAPTDVIVRIETASGSDPSGTLVNSNATVSIPLSNLTNTLTNITAAFDGEFTLLNDTEYFMVTRLSYTSVSDRTLSGVNTANVFPRGVRHTSTNGGSSWSETSSQDMSFELLKIPVFTTPQIQVNISDSDIFNQTPINVSLNTTSNVNMSIFINGILDQTFNDTNFTTALISLNEGQNNLSFKAEDVNGESFNNLTVFLDTINPVLEVNLPSEINSYQIDFTQYINFSDTNLDSCIISISSETPTNCSDSSYIFNFNGNHTINVTVNDTAGNINQSLNNLILVNPNILFSFNDSGSLVEDYTFGGREDESGIVNYTIYNDGLILGNNTLLFEKLGFVSQNFTFEFNTTTNQNFTFNIFPAIINVNIYDRDTETLITDNVSLQLIGPIGDTATTVTGQATLQAINGTAGDYQIIASTANYETESIYFTYSNQENITLDIYMLNSTDLNLGFVTVEVKDTLSFFIEEAIVNLLEWKPSESAYVSVAECQTVSNGKCNLNVELNDKLYKFQATKDSVTKTTASQIITTTGTLVPITLEDITLTATPNSDNIVATFTESINNVTNISTARLEWNLLDGTTGTACVTVYSNPGFSQSVLAQNCTSSSSGILFLTTAINNSFNIVIVGTVADSFNTYTIGSFFHEGTGSLASALRQYNLDIIIPLIFFFIGIGAGLFFGNIYIGLSLGVVLEWIATLIAPNVMSLGMAIVISTISGLIMWGLSRK